MTTQALNRAFEYAATIPHEAQSDFADFLQFNMSQNHNGISGELMEKIIKDHKKILARRERE